MQRATQFITKRFDLLTIGQLAPSVERFDATHCDGTANLIAEFTKQPGGSSYYAAYAARFFDSRARLALLSPVGGVDLQMARRAIEPLRLTEAILLAAPDESTNREHVFINCSGNGKVVSPSDGVSLEDDLGEVGRRRMLGASAQSRAIVVGDLAVDSARELIEFSRRLGAYVALSPGYNQLRHLVDLRPHALVVNDQQGREITGAAGDCRTVFQALLEASPADHLLVMTCGAGSMFVGHPSTRSQREIQPPRTRLSGAMAGRLPSCGCGDVLAGTLAHLLGQARRLVSFELALVAAHFAQKVATALLTGDTQRRLEVQRGYAAMRALLQSDRASSQENSAVVVGRGRSGTYDSTKADTAPAIGRNLVA